MVPFSNSNALAHWVRDVLLQKRIDEVASWRMLEYWFQVELYRAFESGAAGGWRHFGSYEQPYHTNLPRSGSKTRTKWIDLVVAEPDIRAPRTIMWLELKDVGRSGSTIATNAKGLGYDLAALWALDPEETRKLWQTPPPHVVDRGRLEEWTTLAPGISLARHLLGQIVLRQNSPEGFVSSDDLERLWLESFYQRSNASTDGSMNVGRAETATFTVHALVMPLAMQS